MPRSPPVLTSPLVPKAAIRARLALGVGGEGLQGGQVRRFFRTLVFTRSLCVTRSPRRRNQAKEVRPPREEERLKS